MTDNALTRNEAKKLRKELKKKYKKEFREIRRKIINSGQQLPEEIWAQIYRAVHSGRLFNNDKSNT